MPRKTEAPKRRNKIEDLIKTLSGQSTVSETPRSRGVGVVADGVESLRQLAGRYTVPGTDYPVDKVLGLDGASRELNNWSYGNLPVRVNPYAGDTASYLPEVKPGRQHDLADTMLLGADAAGLGVAATRRIPTAVGYAETPENTHRMVQGFYRGFAGDGKSDGNVFVVPQRQVAEYYAAKRAAQTGEAPGVEMVLADPFAGREYGHGTLGTRSNPPMFTRARELQPEDVIRRTRLYAEGGMVEDEDPLHTPFDPDRVDEIMNSLTEEDYAEQ